MIADQAVPSNAPCLSAYPFCHGECPPGTFDWIAWLSRTPMKASSDSPRSSLRYSLQSNPAVDKLPCGVLWSLIPKKSGCMVGGGLVDHAQAHKHVPLKVMLKLQVQVHGQTKIHSPAASNLSQRRTCNWIIILLLFNYTRIQPQRNPGLTTAPGPCNCNWFTA